jgi:hypothetical protein
MDGENLSKKKLKWFIFSRFRDVTIDGIWIGYVGIIDHLYTLLGTFTDIHRLVFSVYPGNGFYRGRFFGFPLSDPLVTAAHPEFL